MRAVFLLLALAAPALPLPTLHLMGEHAETESNVQRPAMTIVGLEPASRFGLDPTFPWSALYYSSLFPNRPGLGLGGGLGFGSGLGFGPPGLGGLGLGGLGGLGLPPPPPLPPLMTGPLTGGGVIVATNPNGTVTTYQITLTPIKTEPLSSLFGPQPQPQPSDTPSTTPATANAIATADADRKSSDKPTSLDGEAIHPPTNGDSQVEVEDVIRS